MSLFKRLFSRSRQRAAAPPSGGTARSDAPAPITSSRAAITLTDAEAYSEPVAPTTVDRGAVSPAPEPNRFDDEQMDEGGDEASDDADGDLKDPTLGSGEALQINAPTPSELAAARTEAERQALAGPHRITPNDPAGPGSLAEALGRLEAEGRVRSEIVDDAEIGFCILYQPL